MEVNKVQARPKQKIIGKNPNAPLGVEPLDFDLLENGLMTVDGIESIRTIGSGESRIFVVCATDADLQTFSASTSFSQNIIIEDDAPLVPLRSPDEISNNIGLYPLGEERPIEIRVLNAEEEPVANADIYLIGGFLPAQGRTDNDGNVTIDLFGDSPDTIKALYVKPGNTNHWSLWIDNPSLNANSINQVVVRNLSEIYQGFPEIETRGWGETAMQLDKIPAAMRGAGVKVAVIDSGIEVDHDDLDAIDGFDFRDEAEDKNNGWKHDEQGHGSHCTGVIAGLSTPTSQQGVIGFAPDANVFGFRVFPGGRTSWIIASLQRCIDEGIDVVNLSLGSAEPSELLHQAVIRAKEAGVTMIAAAGNSAGKVMYPAAWPEVLAVAAIGQVDTFPADSYHAKQVGEHESNDKQYFSAKFTCFGNEVNVCAPGVAILSTVPGDGYAAWDGTSMACPHVTGLAALVLAHRPDIPKNRSAARVEKLYAILKESSVDLGLPKTHQGSGLPLATKALQVSSPPPDDDCAKVQQKLDKLQTLLSDAVAMLKDI